MPESFTAFCNDWYVNQRLRLKMDLPNRRDTVLSLFDRIRREIPSMDRFRRYPNELALESSYTDGGQQWLALRRTSVRSGVVNPGTLPEAYRLHRLILEVAPYFLDISPIDVDYLEVLFGFDLLAGGNHDSIVYEALVRGSPMAALLPDNGPRITDCQPMFGMQVGQFGGEPVEAVFEIKTRSRDRGGRPGSGEGAEDPISVYMTMRRVGPIADLKNLPAIFDHLTQTGETLLQDRVMPTLIVPIREAIVSGRFE